LKGAFAAERCTPISARESKRSSSTRILPTARSLGRGCAVDGSTEGRSGQRRYQPPS
jgi:hypothetical protein